MTNIEEPLLIIVLTVAPNKYCDNIVIKGNIEPFQNNVNDFLTGLYLIKVQNLSLLASKPEALLQLSYELFLFMTKFLLSEKKAS